jgi:hypothetical protein
MAVTAHSPDGGRWKVQRALLRGKDGHGRRIRWRGPSPEWIELLQIGDLAEIPLVGGVFLALFVALAAVLVLLFLPAIALGLLEILIVSTLFSLAVVAATLFGRPVLVRATETHTDASLVWAVKGWRASREVRDQVVAALDAGLDPLAAVDGRAEVVAHRPGVEPEGIDPEEPTRGPV